MSLSARRVWIEIIDILHHILANCVALRKESVDRNKIVWSGLYFKSVALRKESVDRNFSSFESCTEPFGSLSARRVWIEILKIPVK